MFLHIGGAQIVFYSDLVGIFNYEVTENSINRSLLDSPLSETVNLTSKSDHPKSFIVTDDRVYTSPISPLTLSRRRNSS